MRVQGVEGRWNQLLSTGKEATALQPWPLTAWPHVGEDRTTVLLLSLERGNFWTKGPSRIRILQERAPVK